MHDSLGITTENEKELRFEAIHIRGTDEMDTDDVFHYFLKYGPSHIEWIDDASCNVVWADRISAARALHFVSKPIKNLPIRGPCDPFVKDFLNEEQNEQEPGRYIFEFESVDCKLSLFTYSIFCSIFLSHYRLYKLI